MLEMFTSVLFQFVLFYTFTDGFVDAELQIFDIMSFQGEEGAKVL